MAQTSPTNTTMSPGAKPQPVVAKPQPTAAKAVAAEQVQEVRGARAVGVREELEEIKEVGAFGIWLRNTVKQTPSWLVSLIFHMIVMLILAMTFVGGHVETQQLLTIGPSDEDQMFDELDDLQDDLLDQAMDLSTEVVAIDVEVVSEQLDLAPTEDMDHAKMAIELSDFGIQQAPRSDMLSQLGAMSGDGLGARSGPNRARAVKAGGGNAASEAAVARALEWFARHQLPDGGWSFDHTLAHACRGKCSNKGSLPQARNAATATALLPFLGAGQTHMEGKHRQTVRGGLYYLVNNMKVGQQGGSLREGGGRLYSHGLAAIALTEAYGMTRDRALLQPAQAVVNYICYAQDPVGGGWRYNPRQAGDTSVVGWQLMALKSAHMSYLKVPPQVVLKASHFLDSVQSESGAAYGYTRPGRGSRATTAIGLLSRMLLGWNKDNPALQRGVQQLSNWGVSKGDMYYNYYATQAARHWDGEVWKKWNDQMRDWLVNSQVKEGCESGSWFFGSGGDHGARRGGRHYVTSMATMMLEVYYRHMPIYRQVAAEDDFAL